MFTRRTPYHPYKRSAPKPAGFRLRDYINPRRMLDALIPADMRSPAPDPSNNLVKNPRPLAADSSSIPPMPGRFPKPPREKPRLLIPKHRMSKSAKHGHKHFSRRTGTGSHHRHSQKVKEKRNALYKRLRDQQRAARAYNISKVRTDAEKIMKPEHMNDEDKIFLQQLRNLELEDEEVDGIERYRERVARAAAGASKRKREQRARDKEAAKLWGGHHDEEALEYQRRKVEEFLQANEERERAELQHMEEEAERAYEERRRARNARERQVHEEQERRFAEELAHRVRERERKREERRKRQEERRKHEGQERQIQKEGLDCIREDIQRFKRDQAAYERLREQLTAWRTRNDHKGATAEDRERATKEEHERIERERIAKEGREEQARLLAEKTERECQQLLLYEAKWNELQTNHALSSIEVWDMPWPVFGVVSSAAQITTQDVRAFLFHPQRSGVEGKTERDKVETEVLRFCPNEFNTHILPKINPTQQADAKAIVGAVERILTDIMNGECQE